MDKPMSPIDIIFFKFGMFFSLPFDALRVAEYMLSAVGCLVAAVSISDALFLYSTLQTNRSLKS